MTAPLPSSYATISRETGMIAARHHALGIERASYMIARAALLLIRDRRKGAEVAYALADELATTERPLP